LDSLLKNMVTPIDKRSQNMKQVVKLVFLMLPILLLIGCGAKEVKDEEVSNESVVVTAPDEQGASASEGIGMEGDLESAEAAESDKDLLAERKIYFDFDRSNVREEFSAVIEAHAQYLVDNPSASLVIEGHCDERGTREYNIALGEQRAHAVSKMLTLLGASRSQIRTVSYGEERPEVEGHEESSWKWNRRAVLVYAE